jgi:hypothetical protein
MVAQRIFWPPHENQRLQHRVKSTRTQLPSASLRGHRSIVPIGLALYRRPVLNESRARFATRAAILVLTSPCMSLEWQCKVHDRQAAHFPAGCCDSTLDASIRESSRSIVVAALQVDPPYWTDI